MEKIIPKTIALSWAYSIALSDDINDHHIDLKDIFELLGLDFPFDEKCNCIDAEALEKMGAKSPVDLKNDIKKGLADLRYQRGYHTGESGRPPSESWESYMNGYEDGLQQMKVIL